MERTDWLDGGFDSVEARFLMVTAITHHQFSSPIWGEDEVRKLQAELAEIDMTASRAFMDHHTAAVRRGWAPAQPGRAATG
jgi:nitrate reductase alpha subunit